MKELLEVFNLILGEFSSGTIEPGKELLLAQRYNKISEEEKKKFFQILGDIVDGDMHLHSYLVSYVMKVTGDSSIAWELFRLLKVYEYSIPEYLTIEFHISRKLFTSSQKYGQLEYKERLQVMNKYVNKLKDSLDTRYEYIPFENRVKNRILILMEPMLDAEHAPTNRAINIHHALKHMGYEVAVIASTTYNLNRIQRVLYEVTVMQTLSEETMEFHKDFFGEKAEGIYYSFTNENYLEEMTDAIQVIYNFNPEFIISVGGDNLMAEICNHFTTVITRPCSTSLPMTAGRYIADIFEKKDVLGKQLLEEQKQIRMPNITYFRKKESMVTRVYLGIPEEEFAIALAGNRLDNEISDDFLNIFNTILKKHTNVAVYFIGECPNLCERLTERANMHFLGEVQDFANTLGVFDLIVNPPRQGGGNQRSNGI